MAPEKAQDQGSHDEKCPVVAVGASAGGLDAFKRFLAELPGRFGFAVVFLQHLSPRHKSLLPELCRSQRTDLEIVEISDHLDVCPCRIHVAPPGRLLHVQDGVFRLIPVPEGEKAHLLIDGFLSNLAGEMGDQAVAVILSGAGTDGARGIKAVKEAGGVVFAQDPGTAGHPSMPLAAIDTGHVDAILSPERIVQELMTLRFSCDVATCDMETSDKAWVRDFYHLIREKTGYRFDHYKQMVAARRIKRRMSLRGVPTSKAYLEIVRNRDAEALLLAADLMIGVTSFFRDGQPWKVLKKEVVSRLIAQSDDRPIRVWTPACSTGEESYSIAMMLVDELERAGKRREVLVFATDMNDRTLAKAREGRYPVSVTADIPANYVRKFFSCSEDGLSLVAARELRERIVFARQDLFSDPPFSRLDLIICRNLLIYLEPEAQEKCVALFHYALSDTGYLFLGNAESAGPSSSFESIGSRKCRIYRKVSQGAKKSPVQVSGPNYPTPARASSTVTPLPVWNTTTALVQEVLLEEYAPAAVAFDRQYEILYHNGPTHKYLRQPRGEPTQNLLELLPEKNSGRVRSALYRCIHEDRPVSIHTDIEGEDDRKRRITMQLSALREGLYLLVFQQESGRAKKGGKKLPVEQPEAEDSALRQLEIELAATRDDLQSHIEEARSVNEELHSSNEELQAANEELETSREELQSLNEELTTVNAQLQAKIEELEQTNNDLDNFLTSTNIPTLFLDRDLKVKRFTPAISNLVRLIPTDTGRPIIDLAHESLGPELIENARAVLERLSPVGKEIEVDGRRLIRTVLPYRTATNSIEGVVVTYGDITDLRRAEESSIHLASFPRLNPNPVLEADVSGRIIYANPGSKEILESLGLGKEAVDFFLPPDLDDLLAGWDRKSSLLYDSEITIGSKVFAEAVHLVPELEVVRIYARDITERKRAEVRLLNRNVLLDGISQVFREALAAETEEELGRTCLKVAEAVTQSRFGFVGEIGADGFLHDVAISDPGWELCTMYDKTGHRRPPGDFSIHGLYGRVLKDGKGYFTNDPSSHPDAIGTPEGHPPLEAFLGVPLLRNGRTIGMIAVGNRDGGYGTEQLESLEALAPVIVEAFLRKRAEEALRESEERLKRAQEIAHLGSWELDLLENILTWSDEVYRIFGLEPQEFDATYEAFLEAVHPDDRAAVDAAYSGSLREGRDSYEIEHRVVRQSSGEIRYLHEKCQHFRDETGAIIRSVGMVHDVTERKKAEKALRESEAKYRELFENMISGFAFHKLITDKAGKPDDYVFLELNPAFERLTGLKERDILGKPVTEAIPGIEHDPADWIGTYGKVALTGKAIQFEQRFEWLDKWFSVSAYCPMKGYFATIFEDITERKRAEEALRKWSERHAILAEAARLLLTSETPERIVQTICERVMEHLGCHAFFNFLIEDDSEYMRLNAYAGIPEETVREIERLDFGVAVCGYVARDGKRMVAEDISSNPDERTALVHSLGIQAFACHPLLYQDRTIGTLAFGTCDRPRFSDDDIELMRAVSDLVATAMARKQIEEDLAQAKDLAEERAREMETAIKELEGFTYSVSHDLRAPIRHITGFSDLMRKKCRAALDEQGRQYLEIISTASRKLGTLMDELLEFSRMGRASMKKSAVDLAALANEVVESFAGDETAARRIEWTIGSLPTVQGDASMLRLVLTNLLSNAVKFTRKKEQARIEVGHREDEDAHVIFVKDNGAGFDMRYADKLFGVFQRLHRESDFEGTGIGLANVARIVHRHGGRVRAEGTVDGGAVFSFTLPKVLEGEGPSS
jgi:PAS domain S-box-containing protein